MLTTKEVLDLAVSCGLDKKKFMELLQEKTGVTEDLLEEELDNVSGGSLNVIDGGNVNKTCPGGDVKFKNL